MASASLRIPTFDDVKAAQARIAGAAHKTPVLTSRTADRQTGATLYFKAENLQRAGAFKFRGAYNAIAALASSVRGNGVVAYSSGNHAQALAYAGRLLGVPVTIVMPNDAPEIKVKATRGYGAEVVAYDRYTEDREKIAREIAAIKGAALIPPYDHADVIAGQGTAALELIEDVDELDVLVVPLGGGGLLAGCALAARVLSPSCRIIGVEPEAGNDGQQSLRKGEVVHIAPPKSIADGHTLGKESDRFDKLAVGNGCYLIDFVFHDRKVVVADMGDYGEDHRRTDRLPWGCRRIARRRRLVGSTRRYRAQRRQCRS